MICSSFLLGQDPNSSDQGYARTIDPEPLKGFQVWSLDLAQIKLIPKHKSSLKLAHRFAIIGVLDSNCSERSRQTLD